MWDVDGISLVGNEKTLILYFKISTILVTISYLGTYNLTKYHYYG